MREDSRPVREPLQDSFLSERTAVSRSVYSDSTLTPLVAFVPISSGALCLRAVNNEISSVGHSEFQRDWRKLHNATAFDGSNLFARGDSPERDPFSAFNRQKRIIERETGQATNVLGSVTTESLARDKIPNIDKRCLPVPSASQSNQ